MCGWSEVCQIYWTSSNSKAKLLSNECLLVLQLPVHMKSTKCDLTQQLRDLQQKVARLEQERLAAFSHVEIEKQLKVEVGDVDLMFRQIIDRYEYTL